MIAAETVKICGEKMSEPNVIDDGFHDLWGSSL